MAKEISGVPPLVAAGMVGIISIANGVGRLLCLASSLISEQAELQAIQQRAPGWTASKKAHAQWEQQVAQRIRRCAHFCR